MAGLPAGRSQTPRSDGGVRRGFPPREAADVPRSVDADARPLLRSRIPRRGLERALPPLLAGRARDADAGRVLRAAELDGGRAAGLTPGRRRGRRGWARR